MIIDNKNITTNIFRIQAYDSVMYVYFCIGFERQSLLEYTNLFLPNEYEKNDKMMIKYFQ